MYSPLRTKTLFSGSHKNSGNLGLLEKLTKNRDFSFKFIIKDVQNELLFKNLETIFPRFVTWKIQKKISPLGQLANLMLSLDGIYKDQKSCIWK